MLCCYSRSIWMRSTYLNKRLCSVSHLQNKNVHVVIGLWKKFGWQIPQLKYHECIFRQPEFIATNRTSSPHLATPNQKLVYFYMFVLNIRWKKKKNNEKLVVAHYKCRATMDFWTVVRISLKSFESSFSNVVIFVLETKNISK